MVQSAAAPRRDVVAPVFHALLHNVERVIQGKTDQVRLALARCARDL